MIKKKYKLPSGCTVSSFTIRELNGHDEILAAARADIKSEGKSLSPLGQLGLENQEAQRLSLWAVDGQRVNDPNPYEEMDQWSMRTKRFLSQAFNDVNGCTSQELENFTSRAVLLDETQTGVDQSDAPDTDVSSRNGNG